jgi:hypothetical protein
MVAKGKGRQRRVKAENFAAHYENRTKHYVVRENPLYEGRLYVNEMCYAIQ